ncbi:hypothetical protein [Limobrevibacterium gyesilva]|uniref:Uncharacterized protein n=1 Tax=Limobrevibacterium gyesilva TaxID=2991712 RepID=A0AA41YP41_9PROT|nr:hypothetical protein [Limobrevibacterium gyesilva]MCW3476310.1 hypothetical protein [Limobrevibacterium gyesilva]
MIYGYARVSTAARSRLKKLMAKLIAGDVVVIPAVGVPPGNIVRPYA